MVCRIKALGMWNTGIRWKRMLEMRALDVSSKEPREYQDNAKSKSKKTVILLEHEAQVKNCSKRIRKGKTRAVALSPFAAYELDKLNLPYRIIEDFYKSSGLYKLGIENYKKVEKICDIIDKKISSASPAVADRGIVPALFSFYHLKIVYDAATIRLFQLYKLVDAEEPDALYIHNGRRYPFGTSKTAPYLFFDNRESIYARLLACEGWGTHVVMLPFVPQPEDPYLKKSKQKRVRIKNRKSYSLVRMVWSRNVPE